MFDKSKIAYRSPASLSIALLFGSLVGTTYAQNQSQPPEERLEIERGVFEKTDAPMRKLVQFGWHGNQIRLKRDWFDPLAKLDEEEKRKMRLDQLMERGMDREMAERMLGRGMHAHFDDAPVEIAFKKVSEVFSRGGGSGKSGSGEQFRSYFRRGELDGALSVQGDMITIEFTEKSASMRRVDLTDDKDGLLILTVNGNEMLFDFRQDKSGRCRLALIKGDEVSVFSADSFAEFTENHTLVVDHYLLPVFESIGMTAPLLKHTQQVRDAVVAQLSAEQSNTPEHLEKLLADLVADDYETRNHATDSLASGYEQWATQIQSRLASDQPLPPEARKRLQDVMDSHKSEMEVIEFIRRNGLMESTKYLVRLLELCEENQRPVVTQKLQEITGESLGEDVEAWRKWLEDK